MEATRKARKHRWRVQRRKKCVLAVSTRLLCGQQMASHILGVTPVAVIYYAKRGTLSIAPNLTGHKLYDLLEVLALRDRLRARRRPGPEFAVTTTAKKRALAYLERGNADLRAALERL